MLASGGRGNQFVIIGQISSLLIITSANQPRPMFGWSAGGLVPLERETEDDREAPSRGRYDIKSTATAIAVASLFAFATVSAPDAAQA
jgi:hypothetical protein